MIRLFRRNRINITITILLFFLTSIGFIMEIYGVKLMVALSSKEIKITMSMIGLIAFIFFISYLLYYFKLKMLYKTYARNRVILGRASLNHLFLKKTEMLNIEVKPKDQILLFNMKIDLINRNYFASIFELLFSIVFLIGATVYLTSVNVYILVCSVIIYYTSFHISMSIGKRTNQLQTDQLNSLSTLLLRMKESLVNGNYLNLFNRESEYQVYAGVANEQYCAFSVKRALSALLNNVITEMISNYREVIILLILSFFTMTKRLDDSVIFIVIYLSSLIGEPFEDINTTIHNVNATKEVRHEFEEILKDDSRTSSISSVPSFQKDTCRISEGQYESITLKDVMYEISGTCILENVNLEILKGKKYLIVGDSGSGKTTLLNLMMQLVKTTQGEVLLNREKTDPQDIQQLCSVIDQKSDLFIGSVYDNITLFKHDLSEDVLKKLMSTVELNIDPSKKVENDFSNLSGGEIQKIKLARALHHNKEILIFDEAFSAIDPITAHRLEALLLSKDITLITVTHNLYHDLTKLYDVVFTVENKTVISKGAMAS